MPKLRFPEFSSTGKWKERTLEKLADFRRGSFPQPYGLPEWYDEKNGIPFIQVFDVDEGLRLKPQTKNKISELAASQSVFIPAGTVIVTIQGSIGRVAITQYDAYIDRTLLLFEKFHIEIDRIFIAYTLQLLFSIEKQKAPGGIIKTITKEVLSKFVVRIPDIDEQQKIADCLSSLDDLITAEDKKLEALKAHKKGLMQKLFAREIRFKKENGEDFPEWREMKINDLLETIVDNRGKTPPIATSGIPLIESSAVGNFYIDYSKVDKYVSYETYKTWFRKHLKPSDILFSTVGRTGMCSYYSGKIISVVAQNIVGLRFINNSRFMLYLLTEEKNNRYIHSIEMSAVQPSIKVTQFVELEFLVPGSDEQQKIADCLSSVDDLISAQAEKIEALKAHKKGLLQGLFPFIEEVGE